MSSIKKSQKAIISMSPTFYHSNVCNMSSISKTAAVCHQLKVCNIHVPSVNCMQLKLVINEMSVTFDQLNVSKMKLLAQF